MQEIIIDSAQKKRYCKTRISEMEEDGSQTVVMKKTFALSLIQEMPVDGTYTVEINS